MEPDADWKHTAFTGIGTGIWSRDSCCGNGKIDFPKNGDRGILLVLSSAVDFSFI